MSSFNNDNLDSGYGDNTSAARRDENDRYGSRDRQGGAAFDSSDRPYGSSGRDDNNNNNNNNNSSSSSSSSNSYNASGTDSYGTSGGNETYVSSHPADSYGSSTAPRQDNEDSYGVGGNNKNNNNNEGYEGSSRTTDHHGSSGGHELGLSSDASHRDDGAYGADQTDSYGGSSGINNNNNNSSSNNTGSYGIASRNAEDDDSYGTASRSTGDRYGASSVRGADSSLGKFVEKAGAMFHNESLAEKGREKREEKKGFGGDGDEY